MDPVVGPRVHFPASRQRGQGRGHRGLWGDPRLWEPLHWVSWLGEDITPGLFGVAIGSGVPLGVGDLIKGAGFAPRGGCGRW
jgi:hypothetical protein